MHCSPPFTGNTGPMMGPWRVTDSDFGSGAQVSAYAFTFPDESSNGTQIRMMLPLLDLLNHGNEGPAPTLRACPGSWPGSPCLPAHP